MKNGKTKNRTKFILSMISFIVIMLFIIFQPATNIPARECSEKNYFHNGYYCVFKTGIDNYLYQIHNNHDEHIFNMFLNDSKYVKPQISINVSKYEILLDSESNFITKPINQLYKIKQT